MRSMKLATTAAAVLVFATIAPATAATATSATPTGRVEVVGDTMHVQTTTDRPAKIELASESAEFPDGHVENYVSLETGRKDHAYTIVAPCKDAGHDGKIEILCPAELVAHVDVKMGDRGDRLEMDYLLYADLTVHGGLGNDKIDTLGAMTCTVFGEGGNDSLGGCQKDTFLDGGDGRDKITMPWTSYRGYPRILNGGAGSDRITGNVDIDTIDCGPDVDLAHVDARDSTTNCEQVSVR